MSLWKTKKSLKRLKIYLKNNEKEIVNMSFDDELTEEFETIMLTDENGDEAEFVIIDTLENAS